MISMDLPNPTHQQDVTLDQFLKRSLVGQISDFSFL